MEVAVWGLELLGVDGKEETEGDKQCG